MLYVEFFYKISLIYGNYVTIRHINYETIKNKRNGGLIMEYLKIVNSGFFYLLVAIVLGVVTLTCILFLIKSYKAGIKIGMDKAVLRKTIISSATFTILPSVSILIGVIALSGSLGVPFSWLRLSVIGALHYETQVAEIAAESLGIGGLAASNMNMSAFTVIALVMTIGILGGALCCVFFLKAYLKKLKGKKKETKAEVVETAKEETGKKKKPGFGAFATTAMFIGLCAAYIGSYVGAAIPGENSNIMPLLVALMAAIPMAIFEYLVSKKNMKVLDNFSLAVSMLIAMAGAVIVKMFI